MLSAHSFAPDPKAWASAESKRGQEDMWTASADCWTMSILLVLSDFKLSSQVLLETGVISLFKHKN